MEAPCLAAPSAASLSGLEECPFTLTTCTAEDLEPSKTKIFVEISKLSPSRGKTPPFLKSSKT